jgi:hypothetical protein
MCDACKTQGATTECPYCGYAFCAACYVVHRGYTCKTC